MTHGLLLWSPNHCHLLHTTRSLNLMRTTRPANQTPSISLPISASEAPSGAHELSGRERRKLRNERRESKTGHNWREEVEMSLLKKPKKRFATWMDELNLDSLAEEGPQWWALRVARTRAHETVDLIARLLARNFPHIPFKMYTPSVKVKRKLKNGTITVTPKPLFPGCVFLRCVLNKELHDFITECDGVGGFIGSKVGNTKRQIIKPRPVDEVDIEAMFKQAKEEQEKHDKEFEEEQRGSFESLEPDGDLESALDSKPKQKSTKKGGKLVPGSVVRVVSGNFAEFEGSLKKVDRKTKKVTVGVTLFGKESLVEVDMDEIVVQ